MVNAENSAPFDRVQLRGKLVSLASNSVFIGTSSWEYPGWRRMLDEQRYIYRGKFALSWFERDCSKDFEIRVSNLQNHRSPAEANGQFKPDLTS